MARSSRRQFLSFSYKALGAATLLGTFPYFAEVASAQTPKDFKALVCIFLEGGNDGINTIVPLDQNEFRYYNSVRTVFALPQSQLLQVRPTSDNRPFGFHPAMTGLHRMWQQKKLAVVANIGPLIAPITKEQYHANSSLRPSGLFDHYTQSLTWQFCDFGGTAEGWGNRISRYSRSLNTAPKIPMLISVNGGDFIKGSQPTISLQPGANLTLQASRSGSDSGARYAALQKLLALEDQTNLPAEAIAQRYARAFEDGDVITQVLANTANFTTQFPDTHIGRQMQQVARIIAARDVLGLDRRMIFQVRQGGFDTHSNQMKTHHELLAAVSSAMTAFYAATVEMGIAEGVTTFTVSDFGRNIRANEGEGTDHGWGNMSFVLGGAVKGGDFYGQYPSIEIGGPNDIDRNARDRGSLLPTTSVDEYASTFARWYGLDETARRTIFPNLPRFDRQDLGFM